MCGPSNCSQGCCDGSGNCIPYGSQSLGECGAAGNACAACNTPNGANQCNSGVCQCSGQSACTGGVTCCSTGCVNPQIDPNNCSSCGHVCPTNDGCQGGSCYCPYSTCNGACVDLQNDPNNCGTCGHSCLGGAGSCATGTCQPYVVYTNPGAVNDLALDANNNVYWTDYTSNGYVKQCTISNCSSPTTIASGQSQSDRIAVDGTYVFWTNYGASGSVMRCPIGTQCGGSATVLAPATDATGIALDASTLYWTKYTNTGLGGIYSCAKGGCGGVATTLTSSGTYGYYDIVQTNGLLFWTYNGGVLSCTPTPSACANPTPITPSGASIAPFFITADSSNVYWTNGVSAGPVSFCPISGCVGQPGVLATASNPYAIAVDATTVYFTEIGVSTLYTVPTSGGSTGTLYGGPSTPKYVKQNASAICWTTYSDTIMCLAR